MGTMNKYSVIFAQDNKTAVLFPLSHGDKDRAYPEDRAFRMAKAAGYRVFLMPDKATAMKFAERQF